MTGVVGLFCDPDAVADALDALRAAGYREHDVTVLSDTPYPEGAFGESETHHNLYVYPFVGAICGFVVGLLVTIGTQLAYPMVTGGKPILSIPPMTIVIYGGTLLGAIVVTILGILVESRLPDLGAAPYDRRIAEGYLGVAITSPRDDAERLLRAAGAVDIVTDEASHRATR
ncbi:MAG TPA: quinol:electron acceptor oxidoreductase subunit ActD [Chloroflexota bacterium]|nr:quinol:electron acceptor oxidoreductase subunit ActD [Chloroflexota bacterium]